MTRKAQGNRKWPLTPKQQAFCEHYLACGNASEAVRRAGYKTRYPDRIGHQLLEITRVADFIKSHSQKEHELIILTAVERQSILSDIAEDTGIPTADRIRAIDTLNKMTGEYLNRVELSGAVPVIIDDIPPDA
jgi:phage terminase small subunit